MFCTKGILLLTLVRCKILWATSRTLRGHGILFFFVCCCVCSNLLPTSPQRNPHGILFLFVCCCVCSNLLPTSPQRNPARLLNKCPYMCWKKWKTGRRVLERQSAVGHARIRVAGARALSSRVGPTPTKWLISAQVAGTLPDPLPPTRTLLAYKHPGLRALGVPN